MFNFVQIFYLLLFTLSKDDINILNIWKEKSKTSDYYKTAINVWTNTDVIKRNTAKKNNLNYLEIFSININDIITEIKKRINIYSSFIL